MSSEEDVMGLFSVFFRPGIRVGVKVNINKSETLRRESGVSRKNEAVSSKQLFLPPDPVLKRLNFNDGDIRQIRMIGFIHTLMNRRDDVRETYANVQFTLSLCSFLL